jgi:hypothetical protein
MEPINRTIYCLTTGASRYLVDTTSDTPITSMDPLAAFAAHAYWLDPAQAAQVARTMADNLGMAVGLAAVTLVATTAGHWRAATTCGCPTTYTPTPAIPTTGEP